MKDLKLRRVSVIATRHAQIAENKLREESQIESQKSRQRGEFAPEFPDTNGR